MSRVPGTPPGAPPVTLPRLGFVGVGWIGRRRMGALARSGAAEVAAIVEPSEERARLALAEAPGAVLAPSLEALLASGVDGIVIATPSALHASQAEAALARGKAVFCQKPLGRTAREVARVVRAARRADRLLGVDLSYRYTEGMQRIAEALRAGEIGPVYAVELAFHNAYGPDRPWFYDARFSGGGCVMDLGTHLVDLALWALDFPEVTGVTSRLFARGAPLEDPDRAVEDYAVARLDLATGATIQLACSWNLPAGRDAVIRATFYGIRGGLSFSNVNGSFYDFVAERFDRTSRRTLCGPPEAWGGRALVAWAERLAAGVRFDPECGRLVPAARAIDAIYGRDKRPGVGEAS